MLNFLARFKSPNTHNLAPAQIGRFKLMLDTIEREELKDFLLRHEIACYMLSTGVSHEELMRRYEVVCPHYRKGSFPLKLSIDKASKWVEEYRGYLVSQIFTKATAGKPLDFKKLLESTYLQECAELY